MLNIFKKKKKDEYHLGFSEAILLGPELLPDGQSNTYMSGRRAALAYKEEVTNARATARATAEQSVEAQRKLAIDLKLAKKEIQELKHALNKIHAVTLEKVWCHKMGLIDFDEVASGTLFWVAENPEDWRVQRRFAYKKGTSMYFYGEGRTNGSVAPYGWVERC